MINGLAFAHLGTVFQIPLMSDHCIQWCGGHPDIAQLYDESYVSQLIGNTWLRVNRDPEWGDTNQFDQAAINRRTKGYDLIIYHPPEWGFMERLSVTYRGLTKSEAESFVSFIFDSIGSLVEYSDSKNSMKGFIITPFNNMVEEGRRDGSSGCGSTYNISFEIQGLPE